MASKKLKLEVELDTAKAKRQKKELEAESPSSGASVSAASPSMERASRQIKGLGESAQATGINIKAAGKAFAGMAVGLAAGYAAKNMKAGAARDAVEYGGGAVGGAAMGMMFGPAGMLVGSIGGVLKTYLDKSSERDDLIKDYNQGESIYQASRAQMKRFESLTDPRKNNGDISTNIPEMKRISENYKKSTEDFLQAIADELKNSAPDKEKISNLKRNVDWARSMADRYDKAIEDIELKKTTDPRASMTGTDALSKVGGTAYLSSGAAPLEVTSSPVRAAGFSFGFSNSSRAATMSFGGPSSGDSAEKAIQTATERSAKLDHEMVDTLKMIAENTKGGETWQ